MGDYETYQMVQRYFDEAEQEYGVHRDLLNAVAYSESSFNPRARSKQGALGIMQITPPIARKYKVTDPLDPRQNIKAGAAYLADLLEEFDGDQAKAIQAYHMGVTGTYTRPPGPKTRAYVKETMENYSTPGAVDAKYPAPRKKRSLKEWTQMVKENPLEGE
jgi:soluble lytic murein transglycosylase